MKSEYGWLVFYIVMLVLFAQSTYQYAQVPHTVYRVIAAAISILGVIFVSDRVANTTGALGKPEACPTVRLECKGC